MRTFEWWVDFQELIEAVMWCVKETKTITDYLIETFKLEIPCKIILRPIVEDLC
jgi:hypothetical protein